VDPPTGVEAAVTGFAARLFVLALGLALDRLLGEPDWLWRRIPHPVVLTGRLIDGLDRGLNDPTKGFSESRARGLIALLLIVAIAAGIGLAMHAVLRVGILGSVLEAALVALVLAQKSLVDHVGAVARALLTGGLEAGSAEVSKIVGRDVSVLDEAGVARAAIESVAENFSDGVVAPAFWYLVLGLPGLLLYKAVNTADSMIGHKNERYAAFGWAAARLDDVLNFIPARLSALLIALAATVAGLDARHALRCANADARRHKSPNAGWPEAALAGALDLALGGPRRYGATFIDGAWLNAGGREAARPEDIRASVWLVDAAWASLLVITAVAAVVIHAVAR
jgi:adenosylcobinamide-phosphate synthase